MVQLYLPTNHRIVNLHQWRVCTCLHQLIQGDPLWLLAMSQGLSLGDDPGCMYTLITSASAYASFKGMLVNSSLSENLNCKPNMSQNNSKGANRRTNERNHEPREKGARFFGYLGFVLVCKFCVPKLEFNCSYLIYLVHFLKLLWQTSETKSRRLSSHNLIRPGLHPVARGWPYMCCHGIAVGCLEVVLQLPQMSNVTTVTAVVSDLRHGTPRHVIRHRVTTGSVKDNCSSKCNNVFVAASPCWHVQTTELGSSRGSSMVSEKSSRSNWSNNFEILMSYH